MRVNLFKNFYIFNNMDNIVEPNETFDFSKLSLTHPSAIQGGAYFTKIEYNKTPLYIQTSKSQTRQGFVKTGKKYYCDLMFNKNDEPLVQWFENLENKCQKLIFDKKDTWFENSLEENDIESAFNSTIRIYKSGKYYLVRANVKNNLNSLPAVKIYNEQEIPLTINDVTSETNIISILEIQGIKFTSRNFQIEIEIKQIMVLNNIKPLFDNCLIKTNANQKSIKSLQTNLITLEDNNVNVLDDKLDDLDDNLVDDNAVDDNAVDDNIVDDNIVDDNIVDDNLEEIHHNDIIIETLPEEKDNYFDLEIEDLNNFEDIEENTNDLKEVNIDFKMSNSLETIQLKNANQVYIELYKQARKKAKVAKKSALLAYLEAKNIKKTYLLENLNDSDSDIDAEIDEVSESELEDF